VAPGQERHLPHEAWHVVQQKQGRVKPTMQLKDGTPVNDDGGLEHEADMMGAKAVQFVPASGEEIVQGKFGEGVSQRAEKAPNNTETVQRQPEEEEEICQTLGMYNQDSKD
jgi:hypothetical protein